MRVINQNYYEVSVMVQYGAVMESRGRDGSDAARVLSSLLMLVCGCWWPGGQTDCPSNTGAGAETHCVSKISRLLPKCP